MAQARVDHPLVGKVYETGDFHGQDYIAMQLVRGAALHQLEPAPPREGLVRLMKQVCEGLHEAHRQGLIHRDLKPGNILVERTEDGSLHPYVMDFGLARELGRDTSTHSGIPVGTPNFMSPEQAMGRILRMDRRSDVYSLGATLYAVLSGALPFGGESLMEVLNRVVSEDAVPLRRHVPGFPKDLEAIVFKAMAKEPERRYDSALALAQDLGRYLDGEPVLARAPSPVYRLGRWMARNRALAAALVLGLGGILGVSGASLLRLRRVRRQGLWALHFNERIRELEAMERGSAAMPLHDRSPDIAQARRWLGQMEEEAARQGPEARGPGYAALGRGYLLLGEAAKARDCLERAHQYGYRTPATLQSLGIALLGVYRQGAGEAGLILDRGLKEARLAELEARLRVPAVGFLKEAARARPESSHGVLAWAGLAEQRFDEARAEAELALRDRPWDPDPWAVKGEVLLAKGAFLERGGFAAAALEAYAQAAEVYAQGRELARSDPAFPLGEGEALASRLDVLRGQGQCPPDCVTAGMEAARRAGILEPYSSRADLLRARIRSMTAAFKLYHGLDPQADLEAGAEDTRRALGLEPDNGMVMAARCSLLLRLGEYRLTHGCPAEEVLGQAREVGERARGRAPRDPHVLRELASAYRLSAEAALEGGGDGLPWAKRGLDLLDLAARTAPQVAALWNTRGILLWVEGEAEAGRGGDPRPAWREAEACYRRVMALQPSLQNPRTNLGLLMASWARWELEARGEDPRPRLDAALPVLREVLGKDPTLVLPSWAFGTCMAVEGRRRRRLGEDPGPPLREGRQVLERALARDPGLVRLRATLAEIRGLAAGPRIHLSVFNHR